MDTKIPAPDVDKNNSQDVLADTDSMRQTLPPTPSQSLQRDESILSQNTIRNDSIASVNQSMNETTQPSPKNSFFSPEEKQLLFDTKSPHPHSSPLRLLFAGVLAVCFIALLVGIPNPFTRSISGEKFSLRSVLGIDKIYSPLATNVSSSSLDIYTPEDNSVVFSKSITVQGTTTSQSAVIISDNGNHWGTQSDTVGNFTQTISLTPGLNTITIDSFDTSGTNKQETKTIYYSEESL